MPDSKISALPSATVPLAGTEVLPIVQSSVTDKVTAADLLRQNGQTVTTSNPVLSLAQTWNAGGVTFTGLLFNATDTASASASLLLDLQVGGSSRFKVDKTGSVSGVTQLVLGGVGNIYGANIFLQSDAGTYKLGASLDTILARDAANTLALRNGVNAQTFRLYTTYTDASNYERLSIVGNAGSVFQIITQNAGTGTSRALRFGVGGTGIFDIATTGHLNWVTDNTYDIGASGATRPRSLYVGTSIFANNNITATNGVFISHGNNGYNFLTRGYMLASSDGVFRFVNEAQTDFTRLQFGGTTSSFPSIKRNGVTGTQLDIYLADNSGYAPLGTGAQNVNGNLVFGTDNTYDIGASGATRPRSGFFGTNLTVGNTINCAALNVSTGAAGILVGNQVYILTTASGVLLLQNQTANDFSRIQFGGTTSSFPSIKRNGAGLDFRLADDSGYCALTAQSLGLANALSIYAGSAIPAGGSTGAGYKLSSTADFGVFFGSGAPTLSAAKGSLYLRSDGSGTGDRMYVNTNGSTTWTAVTTAA